MGVLIAGSPAVNQVHPSSPGFDVGLLWNQADILVCIGAWDSDPAGIPEHPVGVPITASQAAEGREGSAAGMWQLAFSACQVITIRL